MAFRMKHPSLLERIEGDPALQYKIHKIMSRVWILVTPPLLVVAFLWPRIWLVVGVAYWWNLVRACFRCNRRKHTMNDDEFIVKSRLDT